MKLKPISKKVFAALMAELGCCWLAICCPPGSQQQRDAFGKLAAAHGFSQAEADAMFDAAVAQQG